MKPFLAAIGYLLIPTLAAADDHPVPKPLATGLRQPSAAAVGPDGRVYIATQGDPTATGDGQVLVLDNGKLAPFAGGLDNPRGMVSLREWLIVLDEKLIWRIDRKGQVEVHVPAAAFPVAPQRLSAIDVDEQGRLYVADAGMDGRGAAIFSVHPKTKKVERVTAPETGAALGQPLGVVLDGLSFLIVSDAAAGKLHDLKLGTSSLTPRAAGGGGPLAWDKFGRLYLGDAKGGRISAIPRAGVAPVVIASGFQSLGSFCVDLTGRLIVPDPKGEP